MEFRDYVNEADSNKHQDFASRVASGKEIEQKIIDVLNQQHGWKIVKPSVREDMYQKIDGWVQGPTGREALQIKYRDRNSGGKNDILIEVIKPWYPSMFDEGKQIEYNGRDMIGKAKYYVVLAHNGWEIVVRSCDELKSVAQDFCTFLAENYRKTGSTTMSFGTDGAIMIRPDPSTGRNKVVAFINPMCPDLTYKKDYHLQKPIQ